MNKKIIVVSDMYLPKDCIEKILESAGYAGIEKIYVSNEYHQSKADGSLYREVMRDWYKTDKQTAGIKRGNDISGRRKQRPCVHANGFPLYISVTIPTATGIWQDGAVWMCCLIRT